MDFIAFIAAAAGLIWLAVLMARGGLFAGSLLVMLVGSLFGAYFYSLPTSPVPVTADRVLLFVLAIQAALYRYWGWTQRRPMNWGDRLSLAFVFMLGVSVFTHDWTFSNNLPASRWVFNWCLPLVLYWCARSVTLNATQARFLVGAVAVFGLYLAATAIAEAKFGGSLVFPGYIASSEYPEFLGRARGPFLNPAANGVFLGTCAAALLMLWPYANRAGRGLLVAVGLPLMLAGIYCTLTRSSWMGGAAALGLVLFLVMPRNWRLPAAAGALVVGSALLAVMWDSILTYKRDKGLDPSLAAESAKLRPILATVAWHMFLDRPLWGCGYGQYTAEMTAYLSDRSTDLPLEKARPFVQHNVALAMLVDTGLVGLSIFVAMMACWLRSAWRLWRNHSAPLELRQVGLLFLAMFAAYFPNAMFQDCSLMPMVNMLMFFSAAMVRAAEFSLPATERQEHESSTDNAQHEELFVAT